MRSIYVDMDGVLADFHGEWARSYGEWSREKFHSAVLNDGIFTKLDLLPNASNLVGLLREYQSAGHAVEILGSLGTFEPLVAEAARIQKLTWLIGKGIHFPTNYVNTFAHKQRYAHAKAVMIDDRSDVIEQFIAAGGHGVIYNDADFSELYLRAIISKTA